MKVLMLDSDWDSSTFYCAEFRTKEFLIPSQFSDFQFVTRRGSTVLKNTVSAIMQDADISFITAQGHGTETFFTGDGGESIWSADDTGQGPFAGKIIHLLSCFTASSLGLEMVKKGAKAFFGYAKEFRFLRTEPPFPNPLDDQIVRDFLNVACEVDRRLLSGSKVAEVHQSVMNLYDSAFYQWLPKNQDVAGRLNWNQRYFRSPVTGTEYGPLTDLGLVPIPTGGPPVPVSPLRLINSSDHDWARPIAYNNEDHFVPLSGLWDAAVRQDVKKIDQLTNEQVRELVARRIETISTEVSEETLNKANKIRMNDPSLLNDVELEVALVDRVMEPVLKRENMHVRVAETELNRPLALDSNKTPVSLRNYHQTVQGGLALSLSDLNDADREKLVLARYEFFDSNLIEAQLQPLSSQTYTKDQLIEEINNKSNFGKSLIQMEMLLIAKITKMIELNNFTI